jgi:hypothetical protein
MLSIYLRLRLPSGLFPSDFPTNNLYTFLFSPICATCPTHLILFDVKFLSNTSKFFRLTLLAWNLCDLYLFSGSLSLYLATNRSWSVSKSAALNDRTSSTHECICPSIRIGSICLWLNNDNSGIRCSSCKNLRFGRTYHLHHQSVKIWGFHGGGHEECHFLGYKNTVRTSKETHISATELIQLMLCKIWDFHGPWRMPFSEI